MPTIIEDPIKWCHRHSATVQFHPRGNVTLTVEGYPVQWAYCLEAAINGILRHMEKKKRRRRKADARIKAGRFSQ